jgi:6-phosphogluconolactonase
MPIDSSAAPRAWPVLPHANVRMVPVPAAQAAVRIASDVADRLRSALARRGRALLCVSGGRSPVALFEALSREDLDWSRVQISLADERCVAEQHPDSNAALVRRHLLQERAARAHLVAMFEPGFAGSAQPLDAAELAEQARRADGLMRGIGPADVLILGVGLDGHTASIFPGMAELANALDPQSHAVCLPVEASCLPVGMAHPRITQTLAHLLRSVHVVLPVGPDKHTVLRQACVAARNDLPISHVLHQAIAPVSVWICHET